MNIIIETDMLKLGITYLENIFIEEFLPYANANEIKVYITGLKLIQQNKRVNIEKIKEALLIDDKRVIEAFEYWHNQKIVKLDPKNNLISYLPIRDIYLRSNYERKKISNSLSSPYKKIFDSINKHLITPLREQERQMITRFLNDNKVDIHLLIEAFTINREKYNRTDNSIKTLIYWLENNLNSLEDVIKFKEERSKRQNEYSTILKALGKHFQKANIGERESIDYWLDTLNYSLDEVIQTIRDITKSKTQINMKYLTKVFENKQEQKVINKDEFDYDSLVKWDLNE